MELCSILLLVILTNIAYSHKTHLKTASSSIYAPEGSGETFNSEGDVGREARAVLRDEQYFWMTPKWVLDQGVGWVHHYTKYKIEDTITGQQRTIRNCLTNGIRISLNLKFGEDK